MTDNQTPLTTGLDFEQWKPRKTAMKARSQSEGAPSNPATAPTPVAAPKASAPKSASSPHPRSSPSSTSRSSTATAKSSGSSASKSRKSSSPTDSKQPTGSPTAATAKPRSTPPSKELTRSNSTESTPASPPSWTTWPAPAKRKLLETALRERWLAQARSEQLPPPGNWATWYVRGGRGAGKTLTGAETLAGWITEWPGDYAIVAPTSHDAKTVCVEGAKSGLLRALGGERGGLIRTWNRSEGVLTLENGSKVFTDGADDGAFRIQGKNLHGAWCDEVGLWQKWDIAWHYSLRMAVRFEPARVIATGTPKMGHPLIAYLLKAPATVHTHMRTEDNIENLRGSAIEAMVAEWGGTTLGRQELEGEFIEALEGEMLKRPDWRYYPPANSFYAQHGAPRYDRLPGMSRIVCSWDTAVKDKTSADFWAGQAWGQSGADRILLRLFHAHAGFEQGKNAIRELTEWAQATWPRLPVVTLVEAAGLGPDVVKQLEREVQGLKTLAAKGDKVQRVWAASPALESHNCVLPGLASQTGESYEGSQTPTDVQAFVEECAMFRADMKHAHDDQVDAWAQMVNWTRSARVSVASVVRPMGRVPAIGQLGAGR